MNDCSKKGLYVTLGMGENGVPVRMDLERIPHLMIGGGNKSARNMLAERIKEELKGAEVLCPGNWCEFKSIAEEADKRLEMFRGEECQNIGAYEMKTGKEIRRIVCFTDSISEWHSLHEMELEECMKILGLFGRHAGVHLVLLSDDLLSNTMRRFIPGRIAFRTKNAEESMGILDATGAEKLQDDHTILFTENGEDIQLIYC